MFLFTLYLSISRSTVVVRFPPWKFGPEFSSPAFSTPAIWSHIFQSRVFHPRIIHGPAFSSPAFSASPHLGRLINDIIDAVSYTHHCREDNDDWVKSLHLANVQNFRNSSADQDAVMSMLLTLIAPSAADLRRNHSLIYSFLLRLLA